MHLCVLERKKEIKKWRKNSREREKEGDGHPHRKTLKIAFCFSLDYNSVLLLLFTASSVISWFHNIKQNAREMICLLFISLILISVRGRERERERNVIRSFCRWFIGVNYHWVGIEMILSAPPRAPVGKSNRWFPERKRARKKVAEERKKLLISPKCNQTADRPI